MTYAVEIAAPGDVADAIRIDDDASLLYSEAGLALGLGSSDPFTLAEQDRWRRAATMQRLFFARDAGGTRVGIAIFDRLDGASYLDQLSVVRSAMRRGAGRFLLRHAIAWARAQGDPSLWLTTYSHLPWNRPFYESEGFVVVGEAGCGAGVRHHLDEERRWLPAPEARVAMRLSLAADVPPTSGR